jgi:hypothetical protein
MPLDGEITLSQKQLTRFEVITKTLSGSLTKREASELLGLSCRQIQRLRQRTLSEGDIFPD